MKKVKNVLKLMFFERSKGKEREGESSFQTGPYLCQNLGLALL
jgi:hypothetical protein